MLKIALAAICLSAVLLVVLLALLNIRPVLLTPQAGPSPTVDPAALENHVRTLSQTFHPRCYDHPENLEAVAGYIERHFAAAGGRTHRQSFTADGQAYDNVIADFGPEDGPVLIVGAHYDSYGGSCRSEGGPMSIVGMHYDSYGDKRRKSPVYTPGADDNASGVAGLLVLAELLGRHRPMKRVQLVAYCLEEPPFFNTAQMGSNVHAAATRGSGVQVIGMISLEMIGYFSAVPGSQSYPVGFMKLAYPDTGNFIGVVGRLQDAALTRTIKTSMLGASDLPVYSLNFPPVIPGVDLSDHKSYWSYGYEAVMITDTAYYRNAAYHTENDTADRLDYERMAKVVQGLFASVTSLTKTTRQDSL